MKAPHSPVWCTFPGMIFRVRWDSVVCIATGYGLDSPGIESQWKRIFLTRLDRLWGPPILMYNAYRVFSQGKSARAWRWPPTPSNLEVKERVQLYTTWSFISCFRVYLWFSEDRANKYIFISPYVSNCLIFNEKAFCFRSYIRLCSYLTEKSKFQWTNN
jgi:hypothetical protein